MTGWPLWLLIGVLGSVSFASRVAFLLRPPGALVAAPVEAFDPPLPRLLRYVSPAMLAALLVPALLGGPGTLLFSHGLAGLVALALAVWASSQPTRRKVTVLVTLASGLGTLWLLALVGL